MKTHLLKTIICLVAFGLLTTGCQHTTQKEADNAVKFDSILVDKTYHLLDNPENPNCNLQIKFTYPVSVEMICWQIFRNNSFWLISARLTRIYRPKMR